MAQFQVDSEQVAAANSLIQNSISKLQTEADALLAQLNALSGVWTGAAASSFQDMVARWRSTSTALDGQLADMGRALATAAQQYAEIEALNSRLFV